MVDWGGGVLFQIGGLLGEHKFYELVGLDQYRFVFGVFKNKLDQMGHLQKEYKNGSYFG
jgi:hypothetical protein